MLKRTTLGSASDMDGKFVLKIPETFVNDTLIFSFIGMKMKGVRIVKGQYVYKVTLEEEAQSLEDVVVTGYFQRKKVSQTGAEVVVEGEELRKVGSLNLLQAISAFDPGVRTLENNEFGSDPNRMPEITVRGQKGCVCVVKQTIPVRILMSRFISWMVSRCRLRQCMIWI